MSFKSEAQRKKFQEMVKSGQMDQSTYDTWEAETGDTKLPARLEKPKKRGPNVAYAVKAKRISK